MGSVGGSAGVTMGSSGSSVFTSGVPSGGTDVCNTGCTCFSTPETCKAGCYPMYDASDAFFCSNIPTGAGCLHDSDCGDSGALACAFDVAAGCSAKGTCTPALLGGVCPVHLACTCADTTDPGTCGLPNGTAHEPIAYEGPCTDGGTVGGDASADTGTPPSCAPGGPGMTNCGPSGSGTESCCASLDVPGGTYYRTYTNDGSGPTGEADPAAVSSFRLDKYAVTVGRFRQFLSAWNSGNGYTPPAGSGKHTHLNDGNGLAATGGGFEPGWVASDDSNILPTGDHVAPPGDAYATWTASRGSQENLPINFVNWYESYAFCIWGGGFLPSEAEWEYAAAGGSQQREYPWGSAAPGTSSQYAIYADATTGECFYPSFAPCSGVANIAPVGYAALGAGLWGQLDLAGDVWEWNIDWYAYSYVDPCTDCAGFAAASNRVVRGGDFGDDASHLLLATRYAESPGARLSFIGFRCARSP
jgi:sulfatase modifying factor 1